MVGEPFSRRDFSNRGRRHHEPPARRVNPPAAHEFSGSTSAVPTKRADEMRRIDVRHFRESGDRRVERARHIQIIDDPPQPARAAGIDGAACGDRPAHHRRRQTFHDQYGRLVGIQQLPAKFRREWRRVERLPRERRLVTDDGGEPERIHRHVQTDAAVAVEPICMGLSERVKQDRPRAAGDGSAPVRFIVGAANKGRKEGQGMAVRRYLRVRRV